MKRKNLKKRFLALALALVMALALVPAAALAADSEFTIAHGTELVKYNGSGGDVVVPDGITTIDGDAFKNCTSVTSVVIPEGVTEIKGMSFYHCTNLTSVTIPSGVTSIGYRAFDGCSSLTSVNIPDGVTNISDGAFQGCKALESIVIPDSVTGMGTGVFTSCGKLAKVTLPNGITSIESGTFHSCYSLSEVTLPKGITSIGESAFFWCNSLTKLDIPTGVTSIGGSAFANCSSLTNLVIPNGVTSIGYNTFEATGLISLTIPKSVTSIGDFSIYACPSLKDVYYTGTEEEWKAIDINLGTQNSLTSATIHYNATVPEGPATPEEPAIPNVPELEVPDLGEASIQDSAIQKTDSAAEWVERLELPQYGETLYNVISGTDEKRGAFEEEKNFTLPQASTGPAVSQVDKIEAAEFSLLDLYANPGAELDSAIFSSESFYEVPANAEDQKIDFKKLTMGDFVTTANYNGVYVTKIPYDGAFDTKKTEACEYIAAVFHAFDRDHPEVFWLSGKCKARIMVATDPATKAKEAYFFLVLADKDGFTMRAPAWTAAGSIEAGIARRDAAVDGILKTVNAGTIAGRIKQLNQWITEHNQYNTTENLTSISNEPHECLAALEGRIGIDGPVCDGYSRAFKVLCDKLGIPCVLETGYARPTAASAGEFHMWSLVQVNGAWYGADITWDDPSVKGFVGAKSGRENEKYLLVGADTVIDGMTFAQSHVVKNQAAVGGVDFNNGPVMGTQAYTGLPALPATASALPTNDKLSVDGAAKSPAAYKIGGANYFKLRDVAMLLNGTKAQFNIRYDDAKRAINITTGQTYEPQGYELQPMPAGSATANLSNDAVYIDGVQVDLAAYKISGANFYGIRDLGRRLGFNVGWKQGTGMYIESDKPYSDAD